MTFCPASNTCCRSSSNWNSAWGILTHPTAPTAPEQAMDWAIECDYGDHLLALANCTACSIAGFQMSLQANELWPIADVTRFTGLGRMASLLEHYDPRAKENNCICRPLCDNCCLGAARLVRDHAWEDVMRFHGLCLDCVKHRGDGEDDMRPHMCQWKHCAHGDYLGIVRVERRNG